MLKHDFNWFIFRYGTGLIPDIFTMASYLVWYIYISLSFNKDLTADLMGSYGDLQHTASLENLPGIV